MVMMRVDRLDTPIGRMRLVVDAAGALKHLDWDLDDDAARLLPTRDPAGVTSALRAYFGGQLEALEGLLVDGEGTDFQRRVWAALRQIPAGTTQSYGDLARRIGSPAAVRAVGAANGRNPIGVVVPCHRVIGADGTLTGYAGGLERKRWLLAHEARHATRALGPLFAPSR
ncbi:MAG: methylated-DNA--[protein]-cysteine S-methyltransferase [Deltaproteobacteria bacterium]|nr:methylated-DNA--[protein]-cysteine S-methyltransferase [Deltaproteobacteria bacterium]